MNLSLLDPFAVLKEFPERLTNAISLTDHTTFIKYNHNGDYLAAGLHNGRIAIIDYETNGVIRLLKNQHSRAITSLDWSTCGRYLISSSRDWKINLWDLSTCKVIRTLTLGSAIWSCLLNPKNHFQFTASLFEDNPIFVDISNPQSPEIHPFDTVKEEYDEEEGNSKIDRKHYTLVTIFHPEGEFIIAGTSKGVLNIVSMETLEIIKSFKLTTSNIKNIIISRQNNKMAVNSSDRIIRQITLPNLSSIDSSDWDDYFEVEQKYQDVVNRLQWNSIAFNFSGEYLIASALGSSHDIYMWETSMGSLIKILEGPKEELYDVTWNYKKCCIGATGLDTGTIYVWSIIIAPKWSALAPDFVEVEENIDYEEQEDEFDIVDEEVKQDDAFDNNSTDKVDILTKDIVDARGLLIRDSFVIPITLNLEFETTDIAISDDEE